MFKICYNISQAAMNPKFIRLTIGVLFVNIIIIFMS